MNFVSIALIAVAMSTDAFAAAVSKGAALHKPRLREALRTGAIFGVIEATTPLVGWALGYGAASLIKSWDHWIAFVLLVGLGLRMIAMAVRKDGTQAHEKPARHSFWTLAVTGFATSIDAMVVGVSLAFIDVSILTVAATIGCATFIMVTIGVMAGRVLGAVAGKRAEFMGGIVLIGIGTAILIEHLSAG